MSAATATAGSNFGPDHSGGAVHQTIGGSDNEGWEAYASATKLFHGDSLLVNGSLRWNNANQTGLLGYGGNLNDEHEFEGEASVGYPLSRSLMVGGEYRIKPSNLAFAKENDWFDIFAAWAINPSLSLTGAYTDLGSIATVRRAAWLLTLPADRLLESPKRRAHP